MHLLDHFRPPLSSGRHWHGFHNAWATYIASALNVHLPAGFFAEPNDLYASAFRPLERNGQPSADVWHEPLSIGLELPTMPLWVRGEICLPVELDKSYERTCREQRIEPPMA